MLRMFLRHVCDMHRELKGASSSEDDAREARLRYRDLLLKTKLNQLPFF